ncbi:MAG: hypothetical protein AB1553_02045 [Nitrospirota bacterium]
MATTLKVTAKIGDTTHPKYGSLKKGESYEIEPADFGSEIFEPVELKVGNERFKVSKSEPVGIMLAGAFFRLDKVVDPPASKKTEKEG